MRSLFLSLFFLLSLLSPLATHAASFEVPFTSQAPFMDWREPWQNACEETTLAMIDYYYKGLTFSTREIARDSILHAFNLKEMDFGPSLDENAATIVHIINNYYPWEAYTVSEPSIDDMKKEIDAGRPIFFLADGIELVNPYFHGQPPYHTVVISGYDEEKEVFITQEPGTQYGANYPYPYEMVQNAMHDFVPGNIPNGPKITIFTRPDMTFSAAYDGDSDGLTKVQEYAYGTSPWLRDTDGDGYSDGLEVDKGYSPTLNQGAMEGALIKSAYYPEVYIIQFGKKHHITSPYIFATRGWTWSAVQTVTDATIKMFPLGDPIQ